jgi:ribonuclease P protein component
MVVQVAPQPESCDREPRMRVGFTASRKIGNSVTRNRAKRRLRAAAAAVLANRGAAGMDYVLIARANTAGCPFSSLVVDLESALRRVEAGTSVRRRWRVSSGG